MSGQAVVGVVYVVAAFAFVAWLSYLFYRAL